MDEDRQALLARIEDAALNASAPPQQRLIDGWLVRFSPGKARRARSVNAIAAGRLPLDRKLALAAEVYAEAALPLVVRITPFSRPETLDAELASRGWAHFEPTRVMVHEALDAMDPGEGPDWPPGACWAPLSAEEATQIVGAMRGSSDVERCAHAQRVELSPVPYQGFAIRFNGDVVCCGQFAREGRYAGLYDVATAADARGRGWAALLCRRLLALAAREGASVGYLQVSEANDVARRLYQRLGFTEGYGYHYRSPAGPS